MKPIILFISQLNDRLLAKLEEMEFCSLSVEDKLEVLVALVDRILNSYSVADHMEKKIVESKAAWRHRIKVVLECEEVLRVVAGTHCTVHIVYIFGCSGPHCKVVHGSGGFYGVLSLLLRRVGYF